MAEELFHVADKYDVISLRDICESVLITKLDLSRSIQMYQENSLIMERSEKIKNHVHNLIAQYIHSNSTTQVWKHVCKSNQTLVSDVLKEMRKAVSVVKSKSVHFQDDCRSTLCRIDYLKADNSAEPMNAANNV